MERWRDREKERSFSLAAAHLSVSPSLILSFFLFIVGAGTDTVSAQVLSMPLTQPAETNMPAPSDFQQYQRQRRALLWSLLGDLPARRPPTARVLKTEQRQGYKLEHLELDLNGIQPVPALMLIPDKVKAPAPAMLYMHWHGGDYPKAKEELTDGRKVLQPYAPVYAEKGIVALAIDSWCFGE